MDRIFSTSKLSLFLIDDSLLTSHLNDRYVATYATELITQQRSLEALELFIRYGAPAKPQNLNIYRHLASAILLECNSDVKTLTGLRNIFQNLVVLLFFFSFSLSLNDCGFQVKEVTSPSVGAEFERFLRTFHYLVVSEVCRGVNGLEVVGAKASISLLRYADLIPADRAFYNAGMKAKVPCFSRR